MHTWRSAAQLAMARRGALAWVLAVLAVAWLHVLSLAQLAHMLPGLASSASAPDTRAFTTRTVRIDNAAPQAATTGFAPPPAATRTQKAPSRTVPQAAAPPGITQTEAAIAATESGPGLTPALPEPTALAPGPAPSTEAEAPQPAAGPRRLLRPRPLPPQRRPAQHRRLRQTKVAVHRRCTTTWCRDRPA